MQRQGFESNVGLALEIGFSLSLDCKKDIKPRFRNLASEEEDLECKKTMRVQEL